MVEWKGRWMLPEIGGNWGLTPQSTSGESDYLHCNSSSESIFIMWLNLHSNKYNHSKHKLLVFFHQYHDLLNEVSLKYDHVVRYSRLISVNLPPQILCLHTHTHNLTMHMHVCTSLVRFSTQIAQQLCCYPSTSPRPACHDTECKLLVKMCLKFNLIH